MKQNFFKEFIDILVKPILPVYEIFHPFHAHKKLVLNLGNEFLFWLTLTQYFLCIGSNFFFKSLI